MVRCDACPKFSELTNYFQCNGNGRNPTGMDQRASGRGKVIKT